MIEQKFWKIKKIELPKNYDTSTIDFDITYNKFFENGKLIWFSIIKLKKWKIRKNKVERYIFIDYFEIIHKWKGNWRKIFEYIKNKNDILIFELYPTINSIKFWKKIEFENNIRFVM